MIVTKRNGNETAALETEVQAEEIPQGPSQVVHPGDKECSCGKWQKYQYIEMRIQSSEGPLKSPKIRKIC